MIWNVYIGVAVISGLVIGFLSARSLLSGMRIDLVDYVMGSFFGLVIAATVAFIVCIPVFIWGGNFEGDNLPENCARVVIGHHEEMWMMPIYNGKTTTYIPQWRDVEETTVICAEITPA